MSHIENFSPRLYAFGAQLAATYAGVDAHNRTAVPATLRLMFDVMPYTAGKAGTVSAAHVDTQLDAFSKSYGDGPSGQLAADLAKWVRSELKLPQAKDTPSPRSFANQKTLEALSAYTKKTARAMQLGVPLPAPASQNEIAMPIGQNLLKASAAPGLYYMSPEEQRIFSTQLLDFLFASTTSMTGEQLTKAYQHMLGSAGSHGYQNAVGALFNELATQLGNALSKALPATGRAQ